MACGAGCSERISKGKTGGMRILFIRGRRRRLKNVEFEKENFQQDF